MSMRDLILSRQNRPFVVISQPSPNSTNQDGQAVLGEPQGGRLIYGRLAPLSSRQELMYQSTLGVSCQYELVSLDSSLQNGDRLQDGNGKIYRVVGINQNRIGMGSLESYSKYPLETILFQGPLE